MKTSVEWLWEQIPYEFTSNRSAFEVFEQAKEMEKKQIIDAFWNGDNTDCISEQNSKEFAEQYYTSTYGSKGSDVTSDFDKPFMDFAKQYVENLKTKNK